MQTDDTTPEPEQPDERKPGFRFSRSGKTEPDSPHGFDRGAYAPQGDSEK